MKNCWAETQGQVPKRWLDSKADLIMGIPTISKCRLANDTPYWNSLVKRLLTPKIPQSKRGQN